MERLLSSLRSLEEFGPLAGLFDPEFSFLHVFYRFYRKSAVFEVEDTGIGIDEDALPQVFEAFRQESEGVAREYEGTGLSLSIVKELTDALGGRIEVESEKGTGTRIAAHFPNLKNHD